jgi:hypothetical protein
MAVLPDLTHPGLTMSGRRLLEAAAFGPLAWSIPAFGAESPPAAASRVRPGDPGWPSAAQWAALDRAVSGELVRLTRRLKSAGRVPTAGGSSAPR